MSKSREKRPRLALLTVGILALAGLSAVTPASAVPSAVTGATARPAATAKLGDLRVAITGLPARVAASVKITGPSFPRGIVVTANRTLTNLKPGSYTVTARSLPTAKGRLVPSPATRKAVVVKGKSFTAAIAYTFVGQPVTIVVRVNGKVGGVALPNKPALVSLTLTNQSRTRTLGGFTVVVPKGAGAIKAKSIVARGKWALSVKPCGRTSNCSSLVVGSPVVSRAIPLSKSVILPRGALTVNLTFTAPIVRNRYPLTLTNIGGGYFTVSGSPAVLQVFPGETVIAQPHVSVPLTPVTVGTNSTATASLPNGAYGPVSLFTEPAPCIGGAAPPCDTVTLDGTFVPPVAPKTAKQPHALPGNLYSFAHPASITFTCSAAKCPPAGTTTPSMVRAGGDVSCIVTVQLALECWGLDSFGQLGNSTTPGVAIAQPNPQPIRGVGAVRDVSIGGMHVCAVTVQPAGDVLCWGTNSSGQLGRSVGLLTPTPFPTPGLVSGIAGATAIAAGESHTCAVIGGDQAGGGVVKCWGEGTQGQLGYGSTNSSYTPVAVSGITTAVQVSAGSYHTCAVLTGGSVQCWGANDYGQLGNVSQSAVGSDTPITVTGITTAVEVSAGGNHTCARLEDGSITCWGANFYGELGSATNSGTSAATPAAQAVTLPAAATSISAGGFSENADHTCATLDDNSTWCWGGNFFGEIGTSNGAGTNGATPTPSPVAATASAVATGANHSCVLLTDETVWCWGNANRGQLGVVPPSVNWTPNPNRVTGVSAAGDPVGDSLAYPLSVALKHGGVYPGFLQAPPCTAFPPVGQPVGTIASPTAQLIGFCLDLFATSRDASGTLSRTVLFVEDPKFTAISR